MLAGAKHAKTAIDSLICYIQDMTLLMENINLASETLTRTSDEYVAQRASQEWGLPVAQLCYS